MSINVERLLEFQSKNPDFSESGVSASYMKTLSFIWNGQFMSAANASSEAVISADSDTVKTKFYRVWIEALAQMEDAGSLAQLSEHLRLVGRESPEIHDSCLGLRGMIHLELDQAPAIRLMARTLTGKSYDPYCLEFAQTCRRRGIDSGVGSIESANCQINDYFIWNTLIQDLVVANDRGSILAASKHVQKIFPGSPMYDLIEMHHGFDTGHWHVANASAARLLKNFPENKDYVFYTACSFANSRDFSNAARTVEAFSPEERSHDADLQTIYAEALAELAKESESERDAHKALTELKSAVAIRKSYGLTIDASVRLIQMLEQRIGGGEVPLMAPNSFRAPRSWMVVLSPRRTEEMVNAHDEDIETLHRPMGKEVEPGDVVLFVSRASHTAKNPNSIRQEWRLLAMYRVTSRPIWHPVEKWHSCLELIDRPEHPVPVDAHELKSDINVRGKAASLPLGHHARFGVYSLDDVAMEIMIAAVRRRAEGIDHGKERRGENLSQKKPG